MMMMHRRIFVAANIKSFCVKSFFSFFFFRFACSVFVSFCEGEVQIVRLSSFCAKQFYLENWWDEHVIPKCALSNQMNARVFVLVLQCTVHRAQCLQFFVVLNEKEKCMWTNTGTNGNVAKYVRVRGPSNGQWYADENVSTAHIAYRHTYSTRQKVKCRRYVDICINMPIRLLCVCDYRGIYSTSAICYVHYMIF